MNDLETIVNELEWLITAYAFDGEEVGWLGDAITLLKAQEPRVLKPEDFDGNPERDQYGNLPCWLESKDPLVASGWNRWNEDDFIRPQMRNFRPWTSIPSDEQRKAVKWNE